MNEENLKKFMKWCNGVCSEVELLPPPDCIAGTSPDWERVMTHCPILNEIQRRWEKLEDEG